MDRAALDWKLDTPNRWKVERITGTTGASIGNTMEFTGPIGSPVVKINNGMTATPYGVRCSYNAGTDIFGGFLATDDTIPITITRRVCLLCTVNGVNDYWVAGAGANPDIYDRDWKLGRAWTVVMVDGSVPARGKNITFDAGNIKIENVTDPWGIDCTHNPGTDTVTGKRKSDGKTITIVRRVSLTCQVGNSGSGNSWIALEGG